MSEKPSGPEGERCVCFDTKEPPCRCKRCGCDKTADFVASVNPPSPPADPPAPVPQPTWIDVALAWIKNHGRHTADCYQNRAFERECDCGLWDLKQLIRLREEAAPPPAEAPSCCCHCRPDLWSTVTIVASDKCGCHCHKKAKAPASEPPKPHAYVRGSGWGCVYNNTDPAGTPTNIADLCMLREDDPIHVGSAPTRAEPTRASIQNVGNRIDLFVDGKPHFTVYLDSNSSLYAERFVAAVNVVFNAAEEHARLAEEGRETFRAGYAAATDRIAALVPKVDTLERDLAQAREQAEEKLRASEERSAVYLDALKLARKQAKRAEEELADLRGRWLHLLDGSIPKPLHEAVTGDLKRENAAVVAESDRIKVEAQEVVKQFEGKDRPGWSPYIFRTAIVNLRAALAPAEASGRNAE